MQTNEKIRVMFYSDNYDGTTGYGRVVRELAKRLAKKPEFSVYVEQVVDATPAKLVDNVRILPVFGNRGSQFFISSVVNNINLIGPHVFIPIYDPFHLFTDGLHNINFKHIKVIGYYPIDSIGIPFTSNFMMDKTNRIIALSEYGKKEMNKANIKCNDVLYHGVDTNIFCPVDKNVQDSLKEKFGFNKDDIVFLTVGRNTLRKRLSYLIKSIAIFNKTNTDKRIKFFIHASERTSAPLNLELYVEKYAKEFNVDMSNIKFSEEYQLAEGKNEKEMAELYQMSDYYISVASGEGFGIPIIEAMACGKIPLLANNSTASELIGQNHERGFLIDNHNVEFDIGYGVSQYIVNEYDVANKIQTVLNFSNSTPTLKEEMIQRGISFVKEKCNWDKLADKLAIIILEEMQ